MRQGGLQDRFQLTEIQLQSNRHSIHNSFHLDRSQKDEVHLCLLLQQEDQLRKVFSKPSGFQLATLHYKQATLCDFEDKSVDRLVRSICKFIVEGLVSHVLAQHSGISSQPRNGHANVVIYFEHLILVAGEFRWQLFETAEHNILIRFETQANGSLFDCFHGVLDLEKFSLRRPGDTIKIVESFKH